MNFTVDSECNELPYINAPTFTLITDPKVRLLQTLGGKDFCSRNNISQSTNKTVFFDNHEQDNYRSVIVTNSNFNTMLLHLSFTHPYTVKAQVFNMDFRISFLQAMNPTEGRDELRDFTSD